MATTTIPWGDGSGDNIYLDYDAATGSRSVAVSSDANAGSAARSKDVIFSASGVSPVTLRVVQSAGGGLPAGATAYDYLEGDGTQWIMTGVGAGCTTAQVGFEITFQFLSNTGDWRWAIFGNLANNYYVGMQKMQNDNIRPMCGDNVNRVRFGIAYTKLSASVSSGVFYFINSIINIASSTYTDELCLFNALPAANQPSKMRLWSGMTISIDGQVVRRFQACTDPNGRAAFYDYISRTYFYGDNASGNDFNVGND